MNFSSTNLGRIEKSNKSATSKQNGTNSEEAQKKKINKKWRVNTLTADGFSKTGPFMRFGNHVFRSQ